ncbi:MAG: hypothetical protein H6807_08695 [Planctomycetes bacterium]|nr:hypothetical protein [Planctomycetota bacterium]
MHMRRRHAAHSALAILLLAVSVSAQSLTTTFNTNNGSAGNMFDVKALTTLQIDRFDVNVVNTSGFEVWAVTGGGSYLGYQNSSAGWTLIQTVTSLPSNGTDNPTPLPPLPSPLLLSAGSVQGLYLTSLGGGINYTNGTAQGALYAGNSELEIYEGHGGSYFNLVNVPRVWSGTIYYTNLTGSGMDLAVTGIISPVETTNCGAFSGTELVKATVKNLGDTTIPQGTMVNFEFKVDGQSIASEAMTLAADLVTGAGFTHTFGTTADLSTPGAHQVAVKANFSGDPNASNDELVVTLSGTGIGSFPWVEDFEQASSMTTPPPGWTQELTDASGSWSDWIFTSSPTPTAGTGPAGDHTTGSGIYAYVEDAANYLAVVMRTPCLDLGALQSPRMRYFVHSNDAAMAPTSNYLAIDVVNQPSGALVLDVAPQIGSLGDHWDRILVDLDAFAGQSIQIRFRVRTSLSATAAHDIAIDDVVVFERQLGAGQAPQPGLAILEINEPLNANESPIENLENGPYFATATPGLQLTMGIEGEPNVPVAVFFGPLAPQIATYAGIGQFDIGAGVDPMTGLPMTINYFGNGFAPVTLFDYFFSTAAAGRLDLSLQMPALPAGILTTFQAATATSNGFYFALSNAIELTVL